MPLKEEADEANGPRYVRAMEINEQSGLTGERVHLGGGSVPALVMALQKGNGNPAAVQDLFGSSVLPLFGLDNETATYPFVDLWGNPKGNLERINELCKAIPSDSECLESVLLELCSYRRLTAFRTGGFGYIAMGRTSLTLPFLRSISLSLTCSYSLTADAQTSPTSSTIAPPIRYMA